MKGPLRSPLPTGAPYGAYVALTESICSIDLLDFLLIVKTIPGLDVRATWRSGGGLPEACSNATA